MPADPFGAKVQTMMRKPVSSTLESQAARYLEARRGRRSIRPAPAAGKAASRVLAPLARRFGLGIEQLQARWRDIVGERLAGWSEPESIQRQGGARILVVRARGPAGAVLQAQSQRILERVRQYAGDLAPTRLRVRQGSLAKPSPETGRMTEPPSSSQVSERVETTAEARLLSALDRFGQSVKSRSGN